MGTISAPTHTNPTTSRIVAAEYFDTYHGKLEPRLLNMILNLVAASMVNQYEFDAKRWGKVLSAVAVE